MDISANRGALKRSLPLTDSSWLEESTSVWGQPCSTFIKILAVPVGVLVFYCSCPRKMRGRKKALLTLLKVRERRFIEAREVASLINYFRVDKE